MKTIYKYILKDGYNPVIALPNYDVKILHVGNQDDNVCMWVELPTISKFTGKEPILIDRKFAIFGTGWEIPDDVEYIGTVVLKFLVWHVYELKGEDNAG